MFRRTAHASVPVGAGDGIRTKLRIPSARSGRCTWKEAEGSRRHAGVMHARFRSRPRAGGTSRKGDEHRGSSSGRPAPGSGPTSTSRSTLRWAAALTRSSDPGEPGSPTSWARTLTTVAATRSGSRSAALTPKWEIASSHAKRSRLRRSPAPTSGCVTGSVPSSRRPLPLLEQSPLRRAGRYPPLQASTGGSAPLGQVELPVLRSQNWSARRYVG